MTPLETERRLTALDGIGSLNPMQRLMLNSTAREIALIAPTGSGKTLAFTARVLNELRPNKPGLQALVIAPSRELVTQTAEVIRRAAAGFKTVACYGGHNMAEETRSLEPTPAIVVATPGRLLDHLQRGHLERCQPHTLVFDEYDKALDLGFADEMRRIVRRTGMGRVTILTSATRAGALPDFMAGLNPEVIDCSEDAEAPRSRMEIIEVESPSRDKLQTLIDLLHSLHEGKAIVFVNHRESAVRVYEAVRKAGVPASIYHGEMDQQQRDTAIDLLENGTAPVMIATDLAARGIDISGLNHIIHYHIPNGAETWTHRNGRTARQQNQGTIYVIRSEADSLPDYITFDRPYSPAPKSGEAIRATMTTLRFDAGRKEKISRGDIVGFLTNQAGLQADDIGKIALHDHYTLVAVKPRAAAAVATLGQNIRLKGKRVRVLPLRDFMLASPRRQHSPTR